MTVPLDRLYHYIEKIAENIYHDSVVIYRFWPNGSKNINDLNNLNPTHGYVKKVAYPHIWCNDQEPLDHEYYKNNLRQTNYTSQYAGEVIKKFKMFPAPSNLNYRKNIFQKNLLLHSERRSSNLKLYETDNQLIPVYYWSHALIARDWFRFAEHEIFQKDSTKTFLIYNRAWSNTREYRLRFLDLLVDKDLLAHCKTNCNSIDPELNLHYSQHSFRNPKWRPKNTLENYFKPTHADSNSSADFETGDYNSTDIEVVLETLFDDDRLHLTEKILRPIACGQPFLLAATQGSLTYLREYGFKTFDGIWNEDYDNIGDSEQRLQAIIEAMKTIAEWNDQTRQQKLRQARDIADYNKNWFFSQNFWNLICNELKKNLELAFEKLESCDNFQFWIDHWSNLLDCPEVIEFLNSDQQIILHSEIDQIMQIAKQKLSESKVGV